MDDENAPTNLGLMSEVYSPATWDIYEKLKTSLEPRSPEMLFDLADEHLPQGGHVLDVGCRDGQHLIALLERRRDAMGAGFDPVATHIERAHTAAAQTDLGDRVAFSEGVMQQVDQPDGSIDLIWCREVIEQVDRLEAGLTEMRRVIKPAGVFLVLTAFVTDLLEPQEAAMFRRHKGNVWANLIEADVEATLERAGFDIAVKDVIGTEWREHLEERHQSVSRTLLGLARLRRLRDSIVRDHGQDLYDHVEANLHWEVFQFLGKLKPVVYVLRPVTPRS